MNYPLLSFCLCAEGVVPSIIENQGHAGIPMIFVLSPIFIFLLLPTIVWKIYVARKTLQSPKHLLIKSISLSAGISTFVGIPSIWGFLFCAQTVLLHFLRWVTNGSELFQAPFNITIQAFLFSTFVAPNFNEKVAMIVTFIMLLVPIFYGTLLVEETILWRALYKKDKLGAIRKFLWQTHLYLFTGLALIAFLTMIALLVAQRSS